jgi:hypothetical protein
MRDEMAGMIVPALPLLTGLSLLHETLISIPEISPLETYRNGCVPEEGLPTVHRQVGQKVTSYH